MCLYVCVCVCVCVQQSVRERQRSKPTFMTVPLPQRVPQAILRQEPDENGRSPRSASDPGHPGPESNASPQDRTPLSTPKTGDRALVDGRQGAYGLCK